MNKFFKTISIMSVTALMTFGLASCKTKKKAEKPTTVPPTTETTTTIEEVYDPYFDNLDAGLKKDLSIKDSGFKYADSTGYCALTVEDGGKVTRDGKDVYVVKGKLVLFNYEDEKECKTANKEYVPDSYEATIEFADGKVKFVCKEIEQKTKRIDIDFVEGNISKVFIKKILLGTVATYINDAANRLAVSYAGTSLSNMDITPMVIYNKIEEELEKVMTVTSDAATIDLAALLDNLKVTKSTTKYTYSLDTSTAAETAKAKVEELCDVKVDDIVNTIGNQKLTTSLILDWISQFSDKKVSDLIASMEEILGLTYEELLVKLDTMVKSYVELAKSYLPKDIADKLTDELVKKYTDLDGYLLNTLYKMDATLKDNEEVTNFKSALAVVDKKIDDALKADPNAPVAPLTVCSLVEQGIAMLGAMSGYDVSGLKITKEGLEQFAKDVEEKSVAALVYDELKVLLQTINFTTEQSKELAPILMATALIKDGEAFTTLLADATYAAVNYIVDGITFNFVTDTVGNPESLTFALSYKVEDAMTMFSDLIASLNKNPDATEGEGAEGTEGATGTEGTEGATEGATEGEGTTEDAVSLYPTFDFNLNFFFNTKVSEEFDTFEDSLYKLPELTDKQITDALLDEFDTPFVAIKDDKGNTIKYVGSYVEDATVGNDTLERIVTYEIDPKDFVYTASWDGDLAEDEVLEVEFNINILAIRSVSYKYGKDYEKNPLVTYEDARVRTYDIEFTYVVNEDGTLVETVKKS